MLAVLGGGTWGALQYPPIRARARDLLAQWENGTLLRNSHDDLAQVRVAGGDAPQFQGASSAPEPPAPPPLSFDESPQPLAQSSQPLAQSSQPLAQPSQPLAPTSQPGGLYAGQQVDYHHEAAPGSPVRAAESRELVVAPTASLAELESRLSQLGATYCLLERWQENPPRYRFHCRVQLSAGTEARRFESSGSDPASVMQHVADAVAAAREVSVPLGQFRGQAPSP
jgi:hypothetical protein